MRRCLDEGDDPALHDAVSLWVPDSVRFVFAIAAHLPFPDRGVELSEVHEGSHSDDAKAREVGFFAVKHPEWRLHLERLMRSPVLEVRRRHEQLPPHRRWKIAVCEHAPNHCAQTSPHAFGYTNLLWHIGGGELLENTGLQAVLPKLPPGVLAALVGTPTNDTTVGGNGCRSDEQLKLLKSLVLVAQQVDGGPLGVLVGYLADVLVATYGRWREGPHQVPVAQLKRSVDLLVGCLRVRKLLNFPHGANVAVRDSPFECNTSAVSLA